MSVPHSTRRAMVVSLVVLLTISCASLTLTPTPQLQLPTQGALKPAMVTLQLATATLQPLMATVVPADATLSAASGGGGGGGSGSGNGSGGGAGSGGGGAGGAGSPASSQMPPTLEIPIPGPFVVKQIESLGHETISGVVCNLAATFNVTVAAPKVTFQFQFFPRDAAQGNWAYAYTIASAGESHDAAGSYTISVANAAENTLLLTMTGSDHVAFKGFDGRLPTHYKFNLVHSTGVTC